MNPTPPKSTAPQRRSPWPIAIIAFFIVFISGIVVFVTWAVRQRMDLVRHDYYAEEILFQKQIDSVNRTRALPQGVSVAYDESKSAITIRLPAEHARQPFTGRLHLYRPSDARLDREVNLAPSADGTQQLDTRQLRPGLWKVRVQWTAHGEEFYFDQSVVIGGASA